MNNWFCVIMSGEYEGEQFFVQCDKREDAIKVAKDVANNEKVNVWRTPWSDEDAEWSGLDTY